MTKIAKWHGYEITIEKTRKSRDEMPQDAVHIQWGGQFYMQFVDWFSLLEGLTMKQLLERFEKVRREVEKLQDEEAVLSS